MITNQTFLPAALTHVSRSNACVRSQVHIPKPQQTEPIIPQKNSIDSSIRGELLQARRVHTDSDAIGAYFSQAYLIEQ